MPAEVALQDVVLAMDLPNPGRESYLDPQTGRIVTITDEDRLYLERDDTESLPEWQREHLRELREALDTERLLRLPDSFKIHERATALLCDTDPPIIDIAFQTGWKSLGTFGRTFRDVTGESPGDLRARERAAPHELEPVPHCFVSAAHRPDLTIAVSEKQRQDADGRVNGSEAAKVPGATEVP